MHISKTEHDFSITLTHSAPEYFKKLTFKNKENNFKQLYLKNYDECRVKTEIFCKFIEFSLKQRCFFYGA